MTCFKKYDIDGVDHYIRHVNTGNACNVADRPYCSGPADFIFHDINGRVFLTSVLRSICIFHTDNIVSFTFFFEVNDGYEVASSIISDSDRDSVKNYVLSRLC